MILSEEDELVRNTQLARELTWDEDRRVIFSGVLGDGRLVEVIRCRLLDAERKGGNTRLTKTSE